MEIVFKNSYVRNKELAKEIYGYYYFKRKWLVVCNVFVFASFIANILVAIFEQIYNWEAFILIPLYFLIQFYCYFSQVNTMIKRDDEVHGKEISVETIVTDSFVQTTASTGAVNKLEFDRIRNAVQTKNLVLLRSKANLIYIFRKDSFEKGSTDEFITFLKTKGVKIK